MGVIGRKAAVISRHDEGCFILRRRGTYSGLRSSSGQAEDLHPVYTAEAVQPAGPVIADFPAAFSLPALDGTNGFNIRGIDAVDRSGWRVSAAGDLNNDGFDDVIVGAPDAEPDLTNTKRGEAYVVFGKASGFDAVINLADLDGNNGFRIAGILQNGQLSIVGGIGDVDGDGIDDIAIGAPNASNARGVTYVIFGKAGWSADFDLTTLDGSNGFRVDGRSGSKFGSAVSAAGDINGDGIDDLLVGAPYAASGALNNAGETFVIFGTSSGFSAAVDATTLDGTNGFRLVSLREDVTLGNSVASAGDVNGDGFDDLIVGAPGERGDAFVLFGATSGFAATVDLETLDGTDGFRISRDAARHRLGFAVSSAGDFNGDGLSDLIVGDQSAAGVGNVLGRGRSYVIFGSSDGFGAELDLASLDGTNGFCIRGGPGNSAVGLSVSSAGDFNGDGLDDILVSSFGAIYLIFGQPAGFGNFLDLNDIDGSNGIRFEGPGTGVSVSAAGDVNTDGFDDFIVGADDTDDNSGNSYVVFGYDSVSPDVLTGTIGNDTLMGGIASDSILGLGGRDLLRGYESGDTLEGGAGTDTLVGGPGADVLDGGAGLDWASYEQNSRVVVDMQLPGKSRFEAAGDSFVDVENLRGTEHGDRLSGNAAANTIDGFRGNDILRGRAGNDTLVGGEGSDTLFGNAGLDTFLLDRLDGGSDSIVDFTIGSDVIALRGSVFQLAQGAFSASNFRLGDAAADLDDYVIYDPASGVLYYDSDGSGFAAQVQIATTANLASLTAADFIVV